MLDLGDFQTPVAQALGQAAALEMLHDNRDRRPGINQLIDLNQILVPQFPTDPHLSLESLDRRRPIGPGKDLDRDVLLQLFIESKPHLALPATAQPAHELEAIRQVNGRYRVRHPDLKPLHAEAMRRISSFIRFRISHVPRERNKIADRLVNKVLNRFEADPTDTGIRIREVPDPQ